MSAISRRDLLLGKVAQGCACKDQPVQVTLREAVLGKLNDFPPLGKKLLPGLGVEVESMPQGLRARSREGANKYFAIKMNTRGELVVDYDATWPEDMVFSWMTNEPTRFNLEYDI